MSLCGTKQSCVGCPLSPDKLVLVEHGVYNPQLDNTGRLGEAAEQLVQNGFTEGIEITAALAVFAVIGVDCNTQNLTNFRNAVRRRSTDACQPVSSI